MNCWCILSGVDIMALTDFGDWYEVNLPWCLALLLCWWDCWWVSNGELNLVVGSVECVKVVPFLWWCVWLWPIFSDQYFCISFESKFVLSQDFHVSASSFWPKKQQILREIYMICCRVSIDKLKRVVWMLHAGMSVLC